MKVFKVLSILVLFAIAVLGFSQPVVKAVVDNNEYKVGDLVHVNIQVENNPGLHGLYFDLQYNSDILEFEEVMEGSFLRRIFQDNSLEYALSDETTNQTTGSHLIVSYNLKGDNSETSNTGRMIKVSFRVKSQGTAGTSYRFTFNECRIKDIAEQVIPGVTWQSSDPFTIRSPYSGTYILVKEPYMNQVFYSDNLDLSLICSQGNYKVKLFNTTGTYESDFLDVTNGIVQGHSIALVSGFNELKANLYNAADYNPANPNEKIIAFDTVDVYRAPENQFVKILDPVDHALLNTDMVAVNVSSSFSQVEVNGLTAAYVSDINETHKEYQVKLWLSEGFNTITAVGTGLVDNKQVKFKDSIQVYYQKDDSIFTIVHPAAGSNFKPSGLTHLMIKGEIDSQYKTTNDPEMGVIENTVTLRVVYYPANHLQKSIVLVDDLAAKISESDLSEGLDHSKYMFYNDFDILLDNLDNGELQITAYKNKQGSQWDHSVNRVAYIDNNRLWIDLVQPNVFTSDALDSKAKIKNFNETKEPAGDGQIRISSSGKFELAPSHPVIEAQSLSNVADLIETPDHTLYALVNYQSTGRIKLFRKLLGQSAWKSVASLNNVYGYQLCYTNNGILIAVSNLYPTSNSGLYLLQDDDQIVNIKLPEPINHVQFIVNQKEKIYLYGNHYQSLYAFNMFALESKSGELVIPELSAYAFENKQIIREFYLTEDAMTGLLRVDNGQIHFYHRTGNQYIQTELPLIKHIPELNKQPQGQKMICAEYENGDYNAFLIIKDNNQAELIMQNKIDQTYFRNWIQFPGLAQLENPIHSAGFKNDQFVFLYQKNNKYYKQRGKLFFNQFYAQQGQAEEYDYPVQLADNFSLFITDDFQLYSGVGDNTSQPVLQHIFNKYQSKGTCQFNYVNDDIDGLTGFGFEVDPLWVDVENAIELGFSIRKKGEGATDVADALVFQLEKTALKTLLDASSDLKETEHYQINANFDQVLNKYLVHVEFKEIQKNDYQFKEYNYLNFDLTLNEVGNSSPAIENLTVYKKVKAKICRPDGEKMILPIQGYVYDRTVKEVFIQHVAVPLGRDGSFYYNYEVDSSQTTIPVEIYCYNGLRDRADVNFIIEVISSQNSVFDVQFKLAPDGVYQPLTPDNSDDFTIDTDHETLYLSGNYFGLSGSVTGYEIYKLENNEVGDLIKKGIFQTIYDNSVYEGLSELGTGYEAGYFIDQAIELAPGKQRLIIYCENPGGKRDEFKYQYEVEENGKKVTYTLFPAFNYNMSADQQKILFYLDQTLDLTVDGIPIHYQDQVYAYESESSPYHFSRQYDIGGEIKSINSVDQVYVKGLTGGVTIEEEQPDGYVDIKNGNQFQFKANLGLEPDEYERDFHIAVIPKQTYLAGLKKGVRIRVRKSFENTYFVPDFSLSYPGSWSSEEKEDGQAPFLLTFNRPDLPAQGQVQVTLVINYEDQLSGQLKAMGQGVYQIVDGAQNPLYLTKGHLKQGINRIAWVLQHTEPEGGNTVTMSSSYFDRPGMDDAVFDYINDQVIAPTNISFSQDLTDAYYTADTLPELNISKDKSTKVRVLLNEQAVWVDEGVVANLDGFNLVNSATGEGKNSLKVVVDENERDEYEKEYWFLYDSKQPVVKISTYEATADYTMLTSITATVTEANFGQGFLYYAGNIVNRAPELKIISRDQYQLTWSGLESEQIEPQTGRIVQVEVKDLAGNKAFSQGLTGFAGIERPEEVSLKEQAIVLPQYKGTPVLPGSGHTFKSTRFSPEKYLKRVSVKKQIADSQNFLKKKSTYRDPVYWSKCESAGNVSTNAEIGSAVWIKNELSPINSSDFVKYGYGLYRETASGTGNQDSYFQVNQTKISRGTISFWSRGHEHGGGGVVGCVALKLGNNSNIRINGLGFNAQVPPEIEIDGARVSQHSQNHIYGLNHYYIIFDRDKKLSGQKSMRVFLNGIEIMSTTNDLPGIGTEDILFILSHSGGGVSIDNLKIWDYVVSENPDWESLTVDPESALIPSDALKPVYFSRCESLEKVTTHPEIGNGQGVIYKNNSEIEIGTRSGGKFSNSLYGITSVNGRPLGYWQPQGANWQTPHKGSLSFYVRLLEGPSNFTVQLGGFQLRWNTSGMMFESPGGNLMHGWGSCLDNAFHHVYIIWDENKGLSGGSSVKVYYDQVLHIEYSGDLNSWSTYDGFKYIWHDEKSDGKMNVDVDNVKLWNYIVSENPGWENQSGDPENILTYDPTAILPAYWSRCETTDSLTQPEIATGTAEIDYTSSLTNEPGQFDQSIKITQSPGAGRNFYPFGSAFSGYEKGTLSFWTYFTGSSVVRPLQRIFFDPSHYVTLSYGGQWSHTVHVNNTVVSSDHASIYDQNFHHVYIVWDKNGGLADGKTLRVFRDGNHEVMSTSEPFDVSQLRWYFYAGTCDNDKAASVKLDDIKIWDSVISENPDDLYSDNKDTDLLDGYGKYLVFKVAKDPYENNINSKADLYDNIKFEVIGVKWNSVTEKVEEVSSNLSPLVINDSTKFKYVEGDYYVYYIVNKAELKSKFETASQAANLFREGENYNPSTDIILDPGAVRVQYTDQWSSDFSPADIYFSGEEDTAYAGLIVYDGGYEDPAFNPEYDSFINCHPDLYHALDESKDSSTDRTFYKNGLSEDLSLLFWFRSDDEYLLPQESLYDQNYHRILTFMMGSNDMFHLGYRGKSLDIMDEAGPASMLPAPLALNPMIRDWNLITIQVSQSSQKMSLYINNSLSAEIALSDVQLEALLKHEARYYFGAKAGKEFNSGQFSIGSPFYINRLLTADEISRQVMLKDKYSGAVVEHHFNTATENMGTSADQLRLIGGNDYFTASQNADYTEADTHGSLKASSRHLNRLKIMAPDKENHPDQKLVVFKDATGSSVYNMIVNEGLDQFQLTPKTTGKAGRYYFGDKSSNYGLKKDRYYSVSGRVLAMGAEAEARIVLRINGNEQSMALKQGPFHFIYQNKDLSVPGDVKLYIETKDTLTLSTQMIMNEGNYCLPSLDDLEKTALSTTYSFDLSGKVSFWYKPLNANPDGYVNYAATLFDSEYLKIGTELDQNQDAVYYALIKGDEQGAVWKKLATHVKVDYQWQLLELAYSHEFKVVYFYINGELAAQYEGPDPLPLFGSLQGDFPKQDNIFLGCDQTQTLFAEGYLDHIVLTKYYGVSQYESKKTNNRPAEIIEEGTNIIKKDAGTGLIEDTNSLKYLLQSLDSDYQLENTAFPIDQLTLSPGRYRLTTRMTFKQHEYKDILTFNISDRPKFDFVEDESTPLVFKGEETDLKLALLYDRSYFFENDLLIYSGAAVRINYQDASQQPVTVTKYVCQDFINQDFKGWLVSNDVTSDSAALEWQALQPDHIGLINAVFPAVASHSNVDYQVKYFLFEQDFGDTQKFAALPASHLGLEGSVPMAALNEPQIISDANGYQYKLVTQIVNGAVNDQEIFAQTALQYEVRDLSTDVTIKAGLAAVKDGTAELYYDDILPDYGQYKCVLRLKYKGILYQTEKQAVLDWKARVDQADDLVNIITEMSIKDFNLLYIDKDDDLAGFYLMYETNINAGQIEALLEVFQNNEPVFTQNKLLYCSDDTTVFQDIPVSKGENRICITLKTNGFVRKKEIVVDNQVGAPQLVITNWVDSLISYNNVLFSWKGYYDGHYYDSIQYSYNFDFKGWTTANSNWREVRFYNLEEGYHNFQVKAEYNGIESPVRAVTFFVDIFKPQFDSSKINVDKVYDADGICYAVDISGDEGAIIDASLKAVYLDGEKIDFTDKGAFSAGQIPITLDGINEIIVTAVDKVGNYTDYPVKVDNQLTEIIYPTLQNVKYSPLTVVGKISDEINTEMAIYLFDPMCEEQAEDSFKGWKKAKINADRTFFIEDVFVNPGSAEKEILTTLKMACVFPSGKVFTRSLDVRANQIVMPIEMKLSTHAAEGENSDTYVEIDCKANIPDISSWSVDFDGDGVYDRVAMMDDPQSQAAKSQHWTHKYSSMGLVTPRVRVITSSGLFFSVSDRLIIHEKIIEPNSKMIANPLSMDTVPIKNNTSQRIFVLSHNGGQDLIDAYEVKNIDNSLSQSQFTLNISSLNIVNPIVLRALDNENLIIGSNHDSIGTVYQLKANAFGNYILVASVDVDTEIQDISVDDNQILVSYAAQNYLTQIPFQDTEEQGKVLAGNQAESQTLEVSHTVGVNCRLGLAKDSQGLLVADYYNQRLIRFSHQYQMVQQFGSFGNGEKEFLKPALVKSFANRIFVFDKGRKDIQVFDQSMKPVCTIQYYSEPGHYNYLVPEFFNEITDMDIIAREEGNLLYYYALILSKSTQKMAMLRLPQWEELRAKVRNNKIVYIEEGEIFTAKPDGSDLTKILSSDSIPRIEGTLDYPALSPDGKTLVFTSHIKLYNGAEDQTAEDQAFAYDNVYQVDLESKKLTQLNLGWLNGYQVERPVFNSNGNCLIFSAKQAQQKWQIYVYDLKEKSVTQLFEAKSENTRFPYYSPDDRFVVFVTDDDHDEEIEIIDTQNTSMRVVVTSNNARDSLPVWNVVYPFEVENADRKVSSKIAFVSERDYHKGIYYAYVSQPSEADIRIVDVTKTVETQDVGDDPDSAAILITNALVEGDYPCFTGNGEALIFEYYDMNEQILKKCDIKANFASGNKSQLLSGEAQFVLTNMDLPGQAARPAGMKNRIAHFEAENVNGNDIRLKWSPYTEKEVAYFIQIKSNQPGIEPAEKKVSFQDYTILSGLDMGTEYLVRVFIRENNEEVATSQWKMVKIPEVVAKPTITVDEDNPYLVKLHAWKPDDEKVWKFKWQIGNKIVDANTSRDYYYEFNTSGHKTITLYATDDKDSHTDCSDAQEIVIKSDIEPVIEYVMSEDSSYIELSAENSKGLNINFAETIWSISGPVSNNNQIVTSTLEKKGKARESFDVSLFKHKIDVCLTLKRKSVNEEMVTDVVQKNLTIDLDLKEVIPVITMLADQEQKGLFHFSGEQSKGNIDWSQAQWKIFSNGLIKHQEHGVSTFDYPFPASNKDTVYTVSLTLPRRNDNTTKTVSRIVSVEAAPIEPQIDYQIIELKEGDNVTGAKVLLDCTQSRGSNIDFNQAYWSIAKTSTFTGQTTFTGPTAVFNLPGTASDLVIDVALTLNHVGGTQPVTVTRSININKDYLPQAEMIVNETIEAAEDGQTVILDVLKSTGPNIVWKDTQWVIDGQNYPNQGPVAKIEVPASAEKTKINYTCTLYRDGAQPELRSGQVELDEVIITPLITPRRLSESNPNYYELSVLNTQGINIDWEKTHWYIYDGNQNVIEKKGAVISHEFAVKSGNHGYPVMAEMFFKGSSYPFIVYTTIDVEGDELIPIITYNERGEDPNVLILTAEASKGSNIDWNNVKWTFGDSSEAQYGVTVTHKFPIDDEKRNYKVSLTLGRRYINGSNEVKTAFKEVKIGADEIRPVINARVKGDTLFLSAEDSEGRGLMLDRSAWLFEGMGDNYSYQKHIQGGVIERNSINDSSQNYIKNNERGYGQVQGGSGNVQYTFGSTTFETTYTQGGMNGCFAKTGYARDYNDGDDHQWGNSKVTENADYSDYKDDHESFSNANSHTGAVCRRYIKDANGKKLDSIVVTLFVYRTNSDGSTNGESITVVINLDEAKSGVVYGK